MKHGAGQPDSAECLSPTIDVSIVWIKPYEASAGRYWDRPLPDPEVDVRRRHTDSGGRETVVASTVTLGGVHATPIELTELASLQAAATGKARGARSIVPPPSTCEPPYSTIDCPGLIADTASVNASSSRSAETEITVAEVAAAR